VPREIDQAVAGLKLAAMGVDIDQLTEAQKDYMGSWEHGT
jgi:adenosylhomocysteinase